MGKKIVEKFYPSLSHDFYTNKHVVQECTILNGKRLANKIAGWVTHVMRRIERGPVRGISIKLQEEERERRDNWVPTESALTKDSVAVSEVMREMLERVPLPQNFLTTEQL